MSKAIGDRAAIEFAIGFYSALGAEESIEFAYEIGCNAIQLEGILEHLTPVLYIKGKLFQFNQDNNELQNEESFFEKNQKPDNLSSTTQQTPSAKLTDSQRRRLKVQKDTLQMDWDLRQEKLKQLRQSSIIEASAAIRFQLQQQIQAEETQLLQLNDELDKIEQSLHHGESSFEEKRDTIREQFDRSTPQIILVPTTQQNIETQLLSKKDEIIYDLINKLFDALYSPNIEVGMQKFETIAHKSLFQNGQIDPAFSKNNFSVAFKNVNLYKRPIEIIDTQPTGRTKLGSRTDKEDGKEEKYAIARYDNFKGLYHVRIFFPADDRAAKISGLSL